MPMIKEMAQMLSICGYIHITKWYIKLITFNNYSLKKSACVTVNIEKYLLYSLKNSFTSPLYFIYSLNNTNITKRYPCIFR